MKLTKTQIALLIIGSMLIAIGFFFTIFGHIHRHDHENHDHFKITLKQSGFITILGLIILLVVVFSKKRTAKKTISIQNIILTLIVIGIYLYGIYKSKEPVVFITISTVLGTLVGLMLINVSLDSKN